MRSTYITRIGVAAVLGLTGCTSSIPSVAPGSEDGGTDGTVGDSGISLDSIAIDTLLLDTSVIDGGSGDATSGDVSPADAAADSGGAACGAATDPTCGGGLNCCDGQCKNFQNDPLNCGACSHRCGGDKSMCTGGTCQVPSCVPACAPGEQCCVVPGPGPAALPKCIPGFTCPVGCPLCK
jgi:hypothetical protein